MHDFTCLGLVDGWLGRTLAYLCQISASSGTTDGWQTLLAKHAKLVILCLHANTKIRPRSDCPLAVHWNRARSGWVVKAKFRHIRGSAASDEQTVERPHDLDKELAFILKFGMMGWKVCPWCLTDGLLTMIEHKQKNKRNFLFTIDELAEWRSDSVSALPCERPGFASRTRLREIIPANNCTMHGQNNWGNWGSPGVMKLWVAWEVLRWLMKFQELCSGGFHPKLGYVTLPRFPQCEHSPK